MSKKIEQNWFSFAEYDLATAKALLQTKRYLYVAFMCQEGHRKDTEGLLCGAPRLHTTLHSQSSSTYQGIDLQGRNG